MRWISERGLKKVIRRIDEVLQRSPGFFARGLGFLEASQRELLLHPQELVPMRWRAELLLGYSLQQSKLCPASAAPSVFPGRFRQCASHSDISPVQVVNTSIVRSASNSGNPWNTPVGAK